MLSVVFFVYFTPEEPLSVFARNKSNLAKRPSEGVVGKMWSLQESNLVREFHNLIDKKFEIFEN